MPPVRNKRHQKTSGRRRLAETPARSRGKRLKKLTERECKAAYKNDIEDMTDMIIKSKGCETIVVAPLKNIVGLT